MNDLITFLSARLDEDEATAKAAADCDGDLAWFDSRVTVSGDHTIRTRKGNRPACRIRRDDVIGRWGQTMNPDAVATHVARHDPARVFREVHAKRAHLAAYLHAQDEVQRFASGVSVLARDALLAVVHDDAAVYSDHPDYRQEWAA